MATHSDSVPSVRSEISNDVFFIILQFERGRSSPYLLLSLLAKSRANAINSISIIKYI
jgi:hypothetical protein